MAGFLERIRSKPERQKKIITILISAFITLLIFGFWVMAFVNRNTNQEFDENSESDVTLTEETSPIEVFLDNFKTGIGEVSSYFGFK